MSDAVKLSVASGIATISLNRPHVMNAMDGEMMRQLRPVTEAGEKDSSVRTVVLRGEGAAFMAGRGGAVGAAGLGEPPAVRVIPPRPQNAPFLPVRGVLTPRA